jgi:hypothetical protein
VSAAIVDTTRLAKVVLYSLAAGVGIPAVFALGVTSTAGMVDALRRRRSVSAAIWAGLTLVSIAASVAALVLGIVVMSQK